MSEESDFIFRSLMSFEELCAAAKDDLVKYRKTIDEITQIDLLAMQTIKSQNDARGAGMSSAAKELLATWRQERIERTSKSSEEMSKLAWNHAIDMTSRLYGSDATNFALEALKRESRAN